MAAYYNEIDKYAAAWLRNLISAGLIAPGDVDERDIKDVKPGDLHGYTQCHFFAGIGGWSTALRMAGWPDDRPVWTGSCPCQPFSTAGKQGGEQDPRHLWPTWFELIRERSPTIIFGEQVASKPALEWLDLVSADLESQGYAFGAADLCAAGVSAPHIRQRLWFVGERLADSSSIRCTERPRLQHESERCRDAGTSNCGTYGRLENASSIGRQAGVRRVPEPQSERGISGMANTDSVGQQEPGRLGRPRNPKTETFGENNIAINDGSGLRMANTNGASGPEHEHQSGRRSAAGPQNTPIGSRHPCGLGNPNRSGRQPGEMASAGERYGDPLVADGSDYGANAAYERWSDVDWLGCQDGKWRPVRSGSFPLADGVLQRMAKLRAAGNAIVPQVAAAFIEAYCAGETV